MEDDFESVREVIQVSDEYIAYYRIDPYSYQEGTHAKDEMRLDLRKVLMMDLKQGVTNSGWVLNEANEEYQINVSQPNALGFSYKGAPSNEPYYDDELGRTYNVIESTTHDLLRETKDKKYIRKLRVRKIIEDYYNSELSDVNSVVDQQEVVEDLLGVCEKLQVPANHIVKL